MLFSLVRMPLSAPPLTRGMWAKTNMLGWNEGIKGYHKGGPRQWEARFVRHIIPSFITTDDGSPKTTRIGQRPHANVLNDTKAQRAHRQCVKRPSPAWTPRNHTRRQAKRHYIEQCAQRRRVEPREDDDMEHTTYIVDNAGPSQPRR